MSILEITEAHRKQLSLLLESTDDADVLSAAAQAAHLWGFTPESEEPTDAEWSAAESTTMFIVEIIRDGLKDGSVTASAPQVDEALPKVKSDKDKADADILDKLGI